MVDNPTSNNIDLETFLKSAGQSFTNAQKALVPGLETPVNMMLSNADLELKVAVSSDVKGKMSIMPISSEDIMRGNIDPGLISTIRISFVSSIGEIETKPQSTPTDTVTGKGNPIPVLVGRTLNEATTILKSLGWQSELHAAGSEEIAAGGNENQGRVLRQDPKAGQSADKAKTIVHLWIDLGKTPVREIDGIGNRFGEGLSKIGINTVGELSLASIVQVAAALKISEDRAKSFVDMSNLMSRLAVSGLKDEVVELLVKGAGIRSLEQLAECDPPELKEVCQKAIASGKVRVPRGFRLTIDEVSGWIKAAKSYLGK